VTKQQEARKIAENFIGRPALCYYNNKPRVGHIVNVMQGPAYKPKRSKEFRFTEMPDGEVYVDWKERGWKEPRTFKWDRVANFRLGHPPPTKEELVKRAVDMKALAAEQLANRMESVRTNPAVPKRMRPTIGE